MIGGGRRGQPQQRRHHPLHLVLARAAAAAYRELHGLRRVCEAGHAAGAGRREHRAARLADREGRAHVAAEEDVLDRERRRPVLRDQPFDTVRDRRQAQLERFVRGRRDHAAPERHERAPAALHEPETGGGGAWIYAENDRVSVTRAGGSA